jgi:6-phosphogluconolactonase
MSDGQKRELIVLPDAEALAHHVAEWLIADANATEGPFAIALSGGSTPRRLYQLLAQRPYRDALPWARVHWFLGDERFVPPDDPLSNYRMIDEAMFSLSPAPAANIHAVPTQGLTPEDSAISYERTLKDFYGAAQLNPAKPLFDINLLGLGPDGHTASLFPATEVLQERTRWVAAVIGAKKEARITLTYAVLESSRHIAFLVSGAEKREVLARLLKGDPALPSSHVHPVGDVRVFADAEAAGQAL